MTTDGNHDVLDLVQRWTAAERHKDAGLPDGLLADDFVGVGPLGFVLTRQQCLARCRSGLENRAFAVGDPQVRNHGTAAVVVRALAQETSFQGGDNSGRFRLNAYRCAPRGPLAGRGRPYRAAAAPAGPSSR